MPPSHHVPAQLPAQAVQPLVCTFFYSQFQETKHLHSSRFLQSCSGPTSCASALKAAYLLLWQVRGAQGTEVWHPPDTATTPLTACSKPSSASLACLSLCPGRSFGAVQLLFLYLEGLILPASLGSGEPGLGAAEPEVASQIVRSQSADPCLHRGSGAASRHILSISGLHVYFQE